MAAVVPVDPLVRVTIGGQLGKDVLRRRSRTSEHDLCGSCTRRGQEWVRWICQRAINSRDSQSARRLSAVPAAPCWRSRLVLPRLPVHRLLQSTTSWHRIVAPLAPHSEHRASGLNKLPAKAAVLDGEVVARSGVMRLFERDRATQKRRKQALR